MRSNLLLSQSQNRLANLPLLSGRRPLVLNGHNEDRGSASPAYGRYDVKCFEYEVILVLKICYCKKVIEVAFCSIKSQDIESDYDIIAKKQKQNLSVLQSFSSQ